MTDLSFKKEPTDAKQTRPSGRPLKQDAAPASLSGLPPRALLDMPPQRWLGLPPRLWLVGAMICAAAALRLLPHPLNFAPIGAMALFGGANMLPGGANMLPGGANMTPSGINMLPGRASVPPGGARFQRGGSHILRQGWALAMPLGAMLLSDTALEVMTGWGFHQLMPAVYGSFALIVGLGVLIRARPSLLPVGFAALGASLLFFVITNFAVWAQFETYPHTAAGLAACYLAALPYFWNTLAGDLFYSAVLFGGFALTTRRFPVFAQAETPLTAAGI